MFEEELKDRETNSFQGIGACLEILTFLLMKYNGAHQYDALFERAKNANFDCACGYDRNVEQETQLERCDIYDCIQIAIETGYPESAARACRGMEERNKGMGRTELQTADII